MPGESLAQIIFDIVYSACGFQPEEEHSMHSIYPELCTIWTAVLLTDAVPEEGCSKLST